MEGELANTPELTDGGKNLMLLVCLNEEIKYRERGRTRNSGTYMLPRERRRCHAIAELFYRNESSLSFRTTRRHLVDLSLLVKCRG